MDDKTKIRESFICLLADALEWEEQPDGDIDSNGRMVDHTTYKLIVTAHSLREFCDDLGVRPHHGEGLMDALDRLIEAPAT